MSYQTDIDNFIAHANKNLLQVVREVASEIHVYAVEHTPFDTGRAMSSWNITEGDTPNLDATPELGGRTAPKHHPAFLAFQESAVAGGSPLTKEQALGISIQQQGNLGRLTTPVVTISNNVPYIGVLEFGGRQYAGHYMLSGARNNFQIYVAQAAAGLTI